MISRIPLRFLRSLRLTPVCASFCSNLEKINKSINGNMLAGVKLSKIIEKELKYEKTNYAPDETAVSFIEKAGFQLIETEGDHAVTLEKQVGDVKVIVSFQSRQPIQEEEEQEEAQEEPKKKGEEQQQEEEEQQSADYADFTVYLQKRNGQILCYECTTANGEISVNMVSLVKDLEAHQKVPRFERGLQDYQGPDFVSLDERLQMALVDYLGEYGINDELGAFIEHYSLDKEQRLYMTWLDSLSTFLKN